MISASERTARAQLLRVAEPATADLLRHIRDVGAEQAVADIRSLSPIGDLDVAALAARLDGAPVERELEAAAGIGARLVCPGDPEWPAGLNDLDRIDAGCIALWVRGSAPLGEMCAAAVAVIGARAATDYGALTATELSAGLAGHGWTVVSGLALGIDAAAHRGALSAGGPTIGVLACGVDVVYPAANRSLFERVMETGAVLSEYSPGCAPHRGRFLARNRLIAALTAGTVLVEAASRSGTLATARHAAALGRQVMAVPGPVSSPLSAGCHHLLREDPTASLITSVDEVRAQLTLSAPLQPSH